VVGGPETRDPAKGKSPARYPKVNQKSPAMGPLLKGAVSKRVFLKGGGEHHGGLLQTSSTPEKNLSSTPDGAWSPKGGKVGLSIRGLGKGKKNGKKNTVSKARSPFEIAKNQRKHKTE